MILIITVSSNVFLYLIKCDAFLKESQVKWTGLLYLSLSLQPVISFESAITQVEWLIGTMYPSPITLLMRCMIDVEVSVF